MSVTQDLATHTFKIGKGIYNFRLERAHLAGRGLIIFMPSAKSKLSKNLYPYFPRMKWSNYLAEYCVLYVGDPFDSNVLSPHTNGSWFFSQEGSVLPDVACLIKHILPGGWGKSLIYGSSMGGFSGFILGTLLEVDRYEIECPQVDITKYPGCSWLVKSYLSEQLKSSEWMNVFSFLRINGLPPKSRLNITYNLADSMHIKFICDELKLEDNRELLKSLKPGALRIEICPHSSGFGHVNLSHEEGVLRIINALSSI